MAIIVDCQPVALSGIAQIGVRFIMPAKLGQCGLARSSTVYRELA